MIYVLKRLIIEFLFYFVHKKNPAKHQENLNYVLFTTTSFSNNKKKKKKFSSYSGNKVSKELSSLLKEYKKFNESKKKKIASN